jgi:hypothetical protein
MISHDLLKQGKKRMDKQRSPRLCFGRLRGIVRGPELPQTF